MTSVILHEQTGQPRSCLYGLNRYADRVAQSALTDCFGDAAELRDYLFRQPIKLDMGESPDVERGCTPEQRSRLWPKDGMNCWEATGHWLGWHKRNQTPIEAHLFDSRINGQRHVFPAARFLGEPGPPTPVVLQPPAQSGTRLRMQGLVFGAAQALGALPLLLHLVRRKEYFPWDNVGEFVVQVGGIAQGERTGPVPEAALRQLPPTWSTLRVRQWPTAGGDILFLIVEKDWVPSLRDVGFALSTGGISLASGQQQEGGHGMAYVIQIPASALRSGGASWGGTTVPGAPPP